MASMKCLIRNKEDNGGKTPEGLPLILESHQVKPSSPELRMSIGMS